MFKDFLLEKIEREDLTQKEIYFYLNISKNTWKSKLNGNTSWTLEEFVAISIFLELNPATVLRRHWREFDK